METGTGAMLVAVCTFFVVVLLYLRTNRLEERVASMQTARLDREAEAANSAILTVVHHRSGDRPRGIFLVHNAGKVHATDVLVTIQRYAATPDQPLISGGTVGVDALRAGERLSIDTTTERDDEWPVEVLLTWRDPRGPQSTVREVSR